MNRSLGNTKQLSTVRRLLGLGAFGWLATKSFDLGVGLFEHDLGNDLRLGEIAVAFVRDFDALGKLIVDLLEVETIANQSRQHVRVARRFNFHFAKHSGDDDLNVLVVDLYTLASIDLLNLMAKVLLYRFFTRDTKDIVWNQRTIDQLLTSGHDVAGVNAESFSRGNKVLGFDATFTANDDRTFTTFLLSKDLNHAVDLSHDSRIFRLSSFENLCNTRQTTGDVRNT